jgi:hypothetical protein
MGWDRAQSGPVIPGTPGSDKTLNGPIFVHSPCAPQAAQNRRCTKATERVTFLNLDQPFPKQIFTVVIFGSDRSKFGEPEKEFLNQTICATGTIEDYRGLPQIVAKEPEQILKGNSRD